MIYVIDKLKPKGNPFTIMDTFDIDHKGMRLETLLDNLSDKLTEMEAKVDDTVTEIEMDMFDNILCWRVDGGEWKPLFDFSSNTGSMRGSNVYVGPDEPTDPTVDVWIKTTETGDIPQQVIEIPTKVSELENDAKYITAKDIKDRLRIAVSGKQLVLTLDGEMINMIPLSKLGDW